MPVDTLDLVDLRWTAVCAFSRLLPDRGVAALVAGAQIALFRTRDGRLFAVSHRDPISGAHVMSNGRIGLRDGAVTVMSPVHRHEYDLETGDCLDAPGIRLATYPVRRRAHNVEIATVAAVLAPGDQRRAG